jgi:glucokinase
MLHSSPRLLADIGGTYARFLVEEAAGQFTHRHSLLCAEHADFHAALTAYLALLPPALPTRIAHAGVAIANPVEGDAVRMTNYHWRFSIEAMRKRLGLETLVVVNDFTALAMALPRLPAEGRRPVGGGHARAHSVVGLLGAGSGLGVSGLIPSPGGWTALGTEGGHANFGPRDEREAAILSYAQRQFSHVSYERLLSGPGIELIHRALAQRAAAAATGPLSAPEISRRAVAGSDPLCTQTLAAFCAILGSAASNLAVTLGAFGGIYIGGGIVPKLGEYFDRSPFRGRFEDKGRFSDYLKGIPTFVITDDNATFMGVSAILAEQLRPLGAAGGAATPLKARAAETLGAAAGTPSGADSGLAILGQIHRALDNLSPAEKRVAEHVLAHPRAALGDPIAQIARAAGVSQPTVIRFCRSLGCEGLSDFKLRLATGLSASVPITHAQVTGEDSTLELGEKVLGNTASSILRLREQLNRDWLSQAIALLAAARRVEFYAVGHNGMVALDAQYKFLRFGVPSAAITEPRLQALSAQLLLPGDVAVVISSSGRVNELLEAAEHARQRGAHVVALTASNSPLAKAADVALIVDHVEDLSTQVPMVSRILHLLLIDILAVGVAMRRGGTVAEGDSSVAGTEDAIEAAVAARLAPGTPTEPEAAVRTGPGISAAGPLARLTSHSR